MSQDYIPSLDNLTAHAQSTLDGYDIMTNNLNPLHRIWMGFSLPELHYWALSCAHCKKMCAGSTWTCKLTEFRLNNSFQDSF